VPRFVSTTERLPDLPGFLGVYAIPSDFRLSVVIPVYNERRWLGELVRRLEAVPIPKEIIIGI
jgi:hypothetical protein